MPHRCTNCGRAFADGSKQMLTGCPDCDGKKFEFVPGSAGDAPDEGTGAIDEGADRPAPREPTPDAGDPADPVPAADREDTAQASARRTIVSEDELPATDDHAPSDPGIAEAEGPDLEELRAELNQQFESIKILQPGEYELNLMELYDREEHIVALEEDGRYVIDVPTSWREDDDRD